MLSFQIVRQNRNSKEKEKKYPRKLSYRSYHVAENLFILEETCLTEGEIVMRSTRSPYFQCRMTHVPGSFLS